VRRAWGSLTPTRFGITRNTPSIEELGKAAEGLKNYMLKFGDKCETREMIICTHRIDESMYVYKYFFDIYLGRSELSRTEYLVRMSFPKEGDNVIPDLAINVEINQINDPQ
jgi:hypothetical protein